jgi:IS5 family transposase
MTNAKVLPISSPRKLFQSLPNTDLSRLVAETLALAKVKPVLLDMIECDLDALAIAKKKERIADRDWQASRGIPLRGFDVSRDDGWLDDLTLGSGRPRTPGIVVLLFMVIRGWLGGFKDRKVAMLLAESKTVEICLASLGCRMPAASTLIDNANAVGAETRAAIHAAQMEIVKSEGFDDFQELTFDSTKVEANSAWPTESGIILGLSERAEHVLRLLADEGITIKLPRVMKTVMADIKVLNKQIQLSSGKKDGAKKRKKLYRKIMKAGRKAHKTLDAAYARACNRFESMDFLPSRRQMIVRCMESISVDLDNLKLTICNADKRIIRQEKVPVSQKVLSLSDQDAAMIVKGEREPIVGYKPQLGRSKGGFVVAIIVPAGNAADSGQLRPIVDLALKRTSVKPALISFDDGYTNGDDRDHFEEIGIKVSFSGAKGKRLIPSDEYDSELFRNARNDRSAVESLMYTIKQNHDFDRWMRRGIEAVRDEALEKVIAYNFLRLIKCRDERARAQPAA